MKKLYLFLIATAFTIACLSAGALAQENQQRKMHIIIEENDKVTTDTMVTFDKALSADEIQAIISGITGDTDHPCPAHRKHMMQCDTMPHAFKTIDAGELDSLLEASGLDLKLFHIDSCIHAHGKDESYFIRSEKSDDEGLHEKKNTEIVIMHGSHGEDPVIVEEDGDVIIIKKKSHGPEKKCYRLISESGTDSIKGEKMKIIEIMEDEADTQEGKRKKVIEKTIIITDEGEKAEKTIILESPDKSEKSKKQPK